MFLMLRWNSDMRFNKWPALVALSVLLLNMVSDGLSAQDTLLTSQENAGSAIDVSQFKGALDCTECHVSPSVKAEVNKVTDFVALDEFKRWIDTDVHARSFMQIVPNEDTFNTLNAGFAELQRASKQALGTRVEWGESNLLSKDMCEKLGYSPASLDSTNLEGTQFARDCLTCHAGYDHNTDKLVEEVKRFGVGVGCESCHGPSGKWYDPHKDPDWRKVSPLDKQKLGMIDVRNPAVRASQCLSCHVGNEDEHKVVTHRMFAAGHPPLPGIEVESFAQQTSRHWRPLAEKPVFEFRDQFAAQNHLAVNDFTESRTVVIGGVVALRESLALLGDTATSDLRQWPEFASFDCAACHHDLRADSWRQQRGFRGQPGRPQLHVWPETLIKIGIVSVANKRGLSSVECQKLLDEYKAGRDAIQNVLDQQPFGDAAKMASKDGNGVTQNLVKWLDQVIWTDDGEQRSSLEGFNQADAIEVLQLMTGAKPEYFDPDTEVFDFSSARQLAWAISVVSNELTRRAADGKLSYDNDKVDRIVMELSETMRLKLPGESLFFTRNDEQGKLARLRYIKSDESKAQFEKIADRARIAIDIKDLSDEEKTTIEGGFGKITEKQGELFDAIYQFDRKQFLQQIQLLRECF